MKESRERTAVRAAVIAAALLLAGFTARELWRRRAPVRLAPVPASQPGAPAVVLPVPVEPAPVPQARRVISSVPPLKVDRFVRPPRKTVVPPPPK